MAIATPCADTARAYRELDEAIDTAIQTDDVRQVPHLQILIRGALEKDDLNDREAIRLLEKLRGLRVSYEHVLSDRITHPESLQAHEVKVATASHEYRVGNGSSEICPCLQLPVTVSHDVACMRTSMRGEFRRCTNGSCPAKEANLRGQ